MDGARALLCAGCLLVLFNRFSLVALQFCDQAASADVPEGVIGESAHFPWLGLLRVHLHNGENMKIALTGLVLVKERYAVANSDDISRIPKALLRDDSKAMFIPKSGAPWYCMVKDYMMHPEYEYSTYNTIALVELALDDSKQVPFSPICWPEYFYNTSNQLYAIGYTDDNQLLEKMVYKLQYVKLSFCKDFYNRAGISQAKAPTHIQCGFAKNNKKDCEWENGMALASNSTGKWILIGLSLRGPGCAAPARFIDLFPYLPWIESATDLEEINDMDFRRRKFITGLEVPLHAFHYPYGFKVDSQPFSIERVDKDAINIRSIYDTYEETPGDCSNYNNLLYRDRLRIVDKSGRVARASYRISMYDLAASGYTCVKIRIKSYKREFARLWYRYEIDDDNSFVHAEGPETPHHLIRYYKMYRREPPASGGSGGTAWNPGAHMEANFIKDEHRYENVRNLNLLVSFLYKNEATMNIEVFGIYKPAHLSFASPEVEPTTKNDLLNNIADKLNR